MLTPTKVCLGISVSAAVLLTHSVNAIWADESPSSAAQTATAEPAPLVAPPNVEALAAKLRPSVAIITTTGRDGRRLGVGTGFVLAADGLIATNLHVIGEARPIAVQLADGRKFNVTEVVAHDHRADLALVRIAAQELPALELGDSAEVQPGRPIVAIGNPQGLAHSVVAGVVSANREIDGRPMLQLALPVEPGNSGGPVVDLEGRVLGVLTMKSAVTENLGFAVAVNLLKPLVERPNPVPIARWLKLGGLDEAQWQVVFGARWRRRAGRIVVDGPGESFGGRALCLAQQSPPAVPFDLEVTVKLDDEAGAAGLVFAADGGDRHYGFYPSGGQLRLTRFAGPDINSWTILDQRPSAHYRPGDWNRLTVRCEADRLQCFVNDQLVVEASAPTLTGSRIGLAKFRDTDAQFKDFRAGPSLPPANVAGSETTLQLQQLVDDVARQFAEPNAPPPREENNVRLLEDAPTSARLLRDRARQMNLQAARLENLAQSLHRQSALRALAGLCQVDDGKIDLARSCLWIARLDNADVDPDAYAAELDFMAAEVRRALSNDADEPARLAALDRYLYEENGFHGSRTEYYVRANSYLSSAIDDREGLPITLCVLYMELARRLDVRIVGIPLPGHFVVRHEAADGSQQLIDVFDGARRMTRDEAERRVADATGAPPLAEHFQPAGPRAILVRMLRNLLSVSQTERDAPGSLAYLDATLLVSPGEVEPHWMRALLRSQLGQRQAALEDVNWLLERAQDEINLDPVRQLQQFLLQQRD